MKIKIKSASRHAFSLFWLLQGTREEKTMHRCSRRERESDDCLSSITIERNLFSIKFPEASYTKKRITSMTTALGEISMKIKTTNQESSYQNHGVNS
jgi:hypothetical protein